MKTFEQFQVNEANSAIYAARLKRGNPKWTEGIKLPFGSLKEIQAALESETKDVSQVMRLFSTLLGVHGSKLFVDDIMTSIDVDGELLSVFVKYRFMDYMGRPPESAVMWIAGK